jgi:hypothetical protein
LKANESHVRRRRRRRRELFTSLGDAGWRRLLL